jgi:hypothetical protein
MPRLVWPVGFQVVYPVPGKRLIKTRPGFLSPERRCLVPSARCAGAITHCIGLTAMPASFWHEISSHRLSPMNRTSCMPAATTVRTSKVPSARHGFIAASNHQKPLAELSRELATWSEWNHEALTTTCRKTSMHLRGDRSTASPICPPASRPGRCSAPQSKDPTTHHCRDVGKLMWGKEARKIFQFLKSLSLMGTMLFLMAKGAGPMSRDARSVARDAK